MDPREAALTPRTLIEPARLAGGAVLRSQSDERLIDLARAGNDRAFEAIVHRYRRPLLRYCGRFLTGARAEDAVQQAFMNAYAAIKNDERRIDLRPWLYRIAHNAALNVLRAGRGATEEPIDDQIDGVERPDQAFERRERLADVVAAVQALPPRQRDAIVLHELEGRSYEQIATELRVSDGAVRQLLARARTTLRAGATAVVPDWLLVRLATSADGENVATRIGEAVAAGGGAAVLAKVGAAVVVAGAVAVGAREVPPSVTGGQKPAREASPARAPVSASGAGTAGAGTVQPISASPAARGSAAASGGGSSRGGDARSGSTLQLGGDSRGGGGSGGSADANHDSGDDHSGDSSHGGSSGSGSDSADDSSHSGSDAHGGDDPSGDDHPAAPATPAVDDGGGGKSPSSGPGSQPQSPPVDVPEIDDSGGGKSGSSAAPGNSGPGSSNTRPPDGDE
jgi:RNA polymerase sigma factor (sigma-70 family)